MSEKSFIAIAIELEIASRKFYDDWSKKVTSPAAAQMLLELRDIEQGHVYDLENLQVLNETTELPEPNVMGYYDIDFRPLDDESTLNDILKVALRMEAKSYESYARYAKNFKDDSYNRSFFIHLAEEEKKHVKMIKTMIAESVNYNRLNSLSE